MRLTNYQNAADFLAEVRGYLEQREAVNGLMLGLAIRLVKEPFAYGSHRPYFAVVTEDGQPILAALMTPPYNLLLYSHREAAEPEALELIAANLLGQGWPVPGVNGPLPFPQAFAEVWRTRSGVSAEVGMTSRLYELRGVVPPRYSPGYLRPATTADTRLMIEWFEAFQDEATPHAPRLDSAVSVPRRIADETIFLWDDNGPVSLAGKNRPTQHGISVGPVYTPPALRARGYASSCVAALSQRLLDSGFEYCVLFTNLANPTSNAVYRQIGYRHVCDFQEIKFA